MGTQELISTGTDIFQIIIFMETNFIEIFG